MNGTATSSPGAAVESMSLSSVSIERKGASFANPATDKWPVHVLRLEDIGIDREAFIRDVRPSFERNKWDLYDVKNRRAALEQLGTPLNAAQQAAYAAIQPHRRRAMRKYTLTPRDGNQWLIEPNDERTFSQSVTDYRSSTREFELIEPEISTHADVLTLIAAVAQTVREYRPALKQIHAVLHQVMVVARPAEAASPAPEGLHQDGADYIVSALVIDRSGVSGGVSKVREGRDSAPMLEVELGAGEGIFQADANTPLWHEISPISLTPGADAGHRMTFGIDVHVS
jgi:hypothetical protein